MFKLHKERWMRRWQNRLPLRFSLCLMPFFSRSVAFLHSSRSPFLLIMTLDEAVWVFQKSTLLWPSLMLGKWEVGAPVLLPFVRLICSSPSFFLTSWSRWPAITPQVGAVASLRSYSKPSLTRPLFGGWKQ